MVEASEPCNQLCSSGLEDDNLQVHPERLMVPDQRLPTLVAAVQFLSARQPRYHLISFLIHAGTPVPKTFYDHATILALHAHTISEVDPSTALDTWVPHGTSIWNATHTKYTRLSHICHSLHALRFPDTRHHRPGILTTVCWLTHPASCLTRKLDPGVALKGWLMWCHAPVLPAGLQVASGEISTSITAGMDSTHSRTLAV